MAARSPSFRDRLWVLSALAALGGCGGAGPLLHPAHTLNQGSVSMGAGVSGNFVVGGGAIDSGRGAAAAPGGAATSAEQRAVIAGAIVEATAAPGVAPWVGGRVGAGSGNELGMIYSGRALRLDGRHAFESEKLALSLGLGAAAILTRANDDAATSETPLVGGIADADLGSASGFAVDVPVLVGWRSTASLVQAWLGVRGGFESITGSLILDVVSPDPSQARRGSDFDAQRIWGGALIGLSVGLKPVAVAIELDAMYFRASGSTEAVSGSASEDGFALSPAGALIGQF